VIAAIFSLTALGLTLGFLLGYAGRLLKVESDPLADEIESMLPGSQCGQCGYTGCAPAAIAIAAGDAPVTICPPGGRDLAEQLALKLGVEVDLSKVKEDILKLARVNQEICIGCTRCFKVCPTDAIIGAPKQIHVVILDACTGCGKCVEKCPTECLQMYPETVTLQNWRWPRPALAA
jgi:electron transport complex protein RnfB